MDWSFLIYLFSSLNIGVKQMCVLLLLLAHIILQTNRFSSAGPLLSELHWLQVASRIPFKIATLIHKILSTGTPSYLSSLLNHYQPTWQLRSSSSNLLVQPPSKTKFDSLAFHTAAPLIRNGTRLSRKCSKLIISAALSPRSRASPAPQIRFGWAHPDPVIMTLACVSNRHYYYYLDEI